MTSSQIIKNLKSLKETWQSDTTVLADEMKLRMDLVDSAIRGQELLLRLNQYEDNGYYFGYLLIQSQRIEAGIKPLLLILEQYKSKKEKRAVKLSKDELEIPLGALIKKTFGVCGK